MTDIIAQALAACPVEWTWHSDATWTLLHEPGHNWEWGVAQDGDLCAAIAPYEAHSLMKNAWTERLAEEGIEPRLLLLSGHYCTKNLNTGEFLLPPAPTLLEALAKAIVAVLSEAHGNHIADVGKKVEKDGA